MAKNKVKLDVKMDETAPAASSSATKTAAPTKTKKTKNAKGAGKPSFWSKLAKVFREMISELKKVDWPPLKRTKNNPGVWANTGTVVVVVLFFLIIITAFDAGLLALFKLLVGIQA